MSNFNVSGFLETLNSSAQKKASNDKKDDSIEKIYLSFPGNYGRYQVLPMNSTSTGFPFAILNQTREFKVTKTITLSDGTEKTYDSWIKILPKEAFLMKDSTDRTVCALTANEEQLLRQVQIAFDQLYNDLGGNTKERNPEVNKTIGLMRRRNYTLFYARCLNKWSINNPRTPEKSDFSALFICTAKGFSEKVSDNITEKNITIGTDTWLENVYNRQSSGRTGYLLFSINLPGGKPGYDLSVTHEINNNNISNYVIPEEDIQLMQDPVEGFLGWQASSEPGKLFNARLMEETLATLNSMIATTRSGQTMSTENAASITSASAMNSIPQQPSTNDPMLRQDNFSQITNPGAIMNNNGEPYQNPPQAHINPLNQAPVNNGYTAPAFAGNSSQLPFN